MDFNTFCKGDGKELEMFINKKKEKSWKIYHQSVPLRLMAQRLCIKKIV